VKEKEEDWESEREEKDEERNDKICNSVIGTMVSVASFSPSSNTVLLFFPFRLLFFHTQVRNKESRVV